MARRLARRGDRPRASGVANALDWMDEANWDQPADHSRGKVWRLDAPEPAVRPRVDIVDDPQANVTPGTGQVAAELRRVLSAEPDREWRAAELIEATGRSASAVAGALDWMDDAHSDHSSDPSRGRVWKLVIPAEPTERLPRVDRDHQEAALRVSEVTAVISRALGDCVDRFPGVTVEEMIEALTRETGRLARSLRAEQRTAP